MQPQDEIAMALQILWERLYQLSSINEANIFLPGRQEARYHEILEEAYAALGLVETGIDDLRDELEYQHKRLDAIRDSQLSQGEQP
jgi:hypothetical protein